MALSFCDAKADIIPVWIGNGFPPCFFYTVLPLIHLSITLFCGIYNYSTRRSVSRIRFNRLLRKWLAKLYLIILITLIIHPIIKLILEISVINNGVINGYQIVYFLATFISWLIIFLLLQKEHKYMATSVQTKSYSWTLLVPVTLSFVMENITFISFSSDLWFFINHSTSNNIELGLFCVKYFFSCIIFIMVLVVPSNKIIHQFLRSDDDDDDDLLTDVVPGAGPWSSFKRKLILLWPFLWPKDNLLLQACVVFCIFLLVTGRVVNLFFPIYYKKIEISVESLTPKNQTFVINDGSITANQSLSVVEFRWDCILMYMGLWFLQGGGMGSVGFLNGLRSFLWTWVQQYTVRTTEVQLFRHLHSLSLRWHMGRKTGEVLRIVDRGTSSVNNLLIYIIFNVAPTVIDIIIAIIFFLSYFNNWFAIIILVTMIVYLVVTILVTEWRTKFRKKMNKLDNDMNARAVDSLLNFETVKYYGAEDFETERYREAFTEFQKAEWISNSSSNLLDFLQNIIITGGMLTGSLLSAWYVSNSKLTVGDYVLFASYMVQLCSPINSFGSYYRTIQKSLIDMDNMFELLNVEQEVKDIENAPNLLVSEGQIEFRDVSFHYRADKPILKNVSFVVPAGNTYALVGPSGAGKSTIIRLLFRFYDVQSGNIIIDGQDISKVKQKSLRNLIGVVPQDTVLFNNDIQFIVLFNFIDINYEYLHIIIIYYHHYYYLLRYNIEYGKVGSNLEEIQEAAKVAEIHERILSFPDGYQTVVGERGLKLSGGEKQRVAIARTVLKAPVFVLLDEATSALDTQTERQIQASLSKVCENRTTIIVAHRLSTIIHADQIIVLRDGYMVESGRHEELLQSEDGIYANMWSQQLMGIDLDDELNKTNKENPYPDSWKKRLKNDEDFDDKSLKI